jgi:hypothetical protein
MIERYHTDILQLQQSLEGSVSFPGDPDYLETKSVFNAHVDKNPAIVIFPASIPDILRIMEFAGQKDMRITIRNGGHSTYGQCLIDDGLVLNMKNLNRVVVDPVAKIARVEAGALLRDLDMACAPYHLAVPAGDCPMVGVAGLVLGGGNGFLSRSFGLTCDQLVSAGMVTADGQTLELSNAINAKLFRAIKGAGQGNFGVITELVFRLSEVPESIYGGSLYWPASIAREILQKYRDTMIDAPDAMSLYVRMNQELAGKPVIRVYGMFNGPVEKGKKYLDPVTQWAEVLHGSFGRTTYSDMQRINEQPAPFSPKFFWKNFLIRDLDDAMIDRLVLSFRNRPNHLSRVNLDIMGGVINQVGASESSFIHRDYQYICSIIGVWNDSDDEASCKAWCFDSWKELAGSNSPCYQNYADPFQHNAVRSYFGNKITSLFWLKKYFDSQNRFVGTLFRANNSDYYC